MIRAIQGILASKASNSMVITVGGVSLGLEIPRLAAEGLGSVGSIVQMYTHLQVHDDTIQLYGFRSEDDLHLFQVLIGISGIGPRNALNLLSVMDGRELVAAITEGNVAALRRAQGIGKRGAERIIVELKDKFGGDPLEFATAGLPVNNDAVAALVGLGYSSDDAREAVRDISISEDATSQELIMQALQNLDSTTQN
jgi:Holliday junction DNA helicase RuvA